MYVTDREPPLAWDHRALLDGQPPTLTARAIGTVVCTAATDKKLRIDGDMHVRLMGTICDVFKGVRAEGAMGVEALEEMRGERGGGGGGTREREIERG